MNKKNFSIILLFLTFAVTSCSSPPSNDEVLELIFTNMNKNLVVDYSLSYQRNETKNKIAVFIYYVNYKYIQSGLLFGYTGLGPGKYYKDLLINISINAEIYKNSSGEWHLLRSNVISRNTLEYLWRPQNQKLQEFYADRIVKAYISNNKNSY